MRSENGESAKKKFTEAAVVCDLTLPWMSDCEPKDATLERFRQSGYSCVSLTIGADRTDPLETLQHLGSELRKYKSRDDVVVVKRVEDIRHAKREGKMAIVFNLQGARPLAGSLDMVDVFYDLGIRHLLLAYNLRNGFADGCHERSDSGLSRMGVALISRMNEVGMMVDCSHTGYQSSMDIIEYSSRPVIFSHVNVDSIKRHPRNIKDEQIKACAARGGLIGLTGVGIFLSEDNCASVENLIRHVNYVSELVGCEFVGFGLDVIYYEEVMYARFRDHQEVYPEGYPPPPWEYLVPEQLEELIDGLLRSGYSDEEIYGMLGENFLRVASQVWK